jgi:hypothetical protein
MSHCGLTTAGKVPVSVCLPFPEISQSSGPGSRSLLGVSRIMVALVNTLVMATVEWRKGALPAPPGRRHDTAAAIHDDLADRDLRPDGAHPRRGGGRRLCRPCLQAAGRYLDAAPDMAVDGRHRRHVVGLTILAIPAPSLRPLTTRSGRSDRPSATPAATRATSAGWLARLRRQSDRRPSGRAIATAGRTPNRSFWSPSVRVGRLLTATPESAI